MQRIVWKWFVVLCVVGLALPMPSAQAFQDTRSPLAVRKGSQVRNLQQILSNIRRCQRGCHDCWYEYVPGVVNYCLGLRDWNNGSWRSGMALLKLAASWGSKGAQYTLGLIYFKGEHVAADRVRSLAWLMLANERHNDPQIALVERSVLKLATPDQKRQAQRLFRQLSKRYGDKTAATRAWRHIRRRLTSWPTRYARNVCVRKGHGRVPWTHGILADPHVLCLPSGPFAKSLTRIVIPYFGGVTGTVSVGPLRSVTAPAAASSSP